MPSRQPLNQEEAELVEQHLQVASRAVWNVIRFIPLAKAGLERDDAMAEGHVALCDAARDWSDNGEGPFAGYAFVRVRRRIIDWLRREGPLRKGGALRPMLVPWEDAGDLRPDGSESAGTESQLRPEDLQPDHAELVAGDDWVEDALSTLPPSMQFVMRMTLDGMEVEAIARLGNISVDTVYQTRTNALRRLRRQTDVSG